MLCEIPNHQRTKNGIYLRLLSRKQKDRKSLLKPRPTSLSDILCKVSQAHKLSLSLCLQHANIISETISPRKEEETLSPTPRLKQEILGRPKGWWARQTSNTSEKPVLLLPQSHHTSKFQSSYKILHSDSPAENASKNYRYENIAENFLSRALCCATSSEQR